MYDFFSNLLYNFFIAFGVVVGGSILAGVAAFINEHPPLKVMIDMAATIKIWAVAVALGGTFSSFEAIEQGLFKGDMRSAVKQVVYIMMALMGANLGYYLIKMIQRCGKLWIE